MTFNLAPTASAQHYRLEAHDSVESTNALALERLRGGDEGRLWIVSKHQRSGRGRRGRAWETASGNLAATLALRDVPGPIAATLGFVAGLAMTDALSAVAPMARVAVGVDGGEGKSGRFELKWPNDVLAGGAKLCGILLESLAGASGVSVAVGMGVNVVSSPHGLPYATTSLAALGAKATAEDLFMALSDAWCVRMSAWNEGRGLEAIRRAWLGRAAGLGAEVAVRLDGEVFRGTFETIDEDCRFVVRGRAGELRRIAAGDVHFGGVATVAAAL